MVERPILFSASMVRALLRGSKRQTRRALRHQPAVVRDSVSVPGGIEDGEGHLLRNRYGVAGDRLWVKETWRPWCLRSGVRVDYAADGAQRVFSGDAVPADWRAPNAASRGNITPLFMPRWASRITLQVEGVRIQRLLDVTEEEALREGIEPGDGGFHVEAGQCFARTPRESFLLLWDYINGVGSSVRNPWVWAVGFSVPCR